MGPVFFSQSFDVRRSTFDVCHLTYFSVAYLLATSSQLITLKNAVI